jgi:hypothetical protein
MSYDPILKTMQSSIITIGFSEAKTSARLAALEPIRVTEGPDAIWIERDKPFYAAEKIKALTMDGLREKLVHAASWS